MATQQPLEVTVAVLGKSMDDCQRLEQQCRAENRQEHAELFDRMREMEKQMALFGQRLAMWAAGGSIIGGAIVALVTALLKDRVAH